MKKTKTQTEKLNKKNAKGIKRTRAGAKTAAELQIEVRDGKKTAGEACKQRATPEPVRKITAIVTPEGMTSQIIDSPVKLVLNGTETADQVKARLPILDADDRKLLADRKTPSLNGTGKVDGMYAEIVEFERKTGQPWFTFAEKGESWDAFKRRGMPTEKPSQTLVTAIETLKALIPSEESSTVLRQPTQAKPASKPVPEKKAHQEEKSVLNSFGVAFGYGPTGRPQIYGESISAIMRWIGAKGWSVGECAALVASLKIKDAPAPAGYNSFIRAGEKGTRPVPTFSEEQERALGAACGKIVIREALAPIKPSRKK